MNNSKNHVRVRKNVKKHIPKDKLCEVRILYRLVKEAINDLKGTGLLVNVVIITTMTAILTIFGVFFRSTLSISSFAKELGKVLEISVYLKNDTNIDYATKQIEGVEHVTKITLIPKQVSWDNLKKELDLPEISNPLPDTLHVRVDSPANVESVFDSVKKLSYVEDVNYAKDLAEKINTANNIVSHLMVFVVAVIGILTVTIINNTILLVIQSRKDEIEIMRLMGVSNWYIRFPLLLQGAYYGFMGALVSIIPVYMVHKHLLTVHNFFFVPSADYALNLVILTVFLTGIIFGAGGSFICIKKHLQV